MNDAPFIKERAEPGVHPEPGQSEGAFESHLFDKTELKGDLTEGASDKPLPASFDGSPDALDVLTSQVETYHGTGNKPVARQQVGELLADWKSNTFASLISAARAELARGNETAYKELKRELPSATVSGTSDGWRADSRMKTHSGAYILDVDLKTNPQLADRATFTRAKHSVGSHSNVLAVVESPGGGLKVVVLGPADFAVHRQFFAYASKAILNPFGLVGDTSCINESRLTFSTHDPELLMNHKAVRLALPHDMPNTSEKSEARIKPVLRRSQRGIPWRKGVTTREDIEAALASLPPLSHNEWVKVIAAVKDGSEQGIIGRDEVIPLLQQYLPEEDIAMYEYKVGKALDRVHLGSLFHMARQFEASPMKKGSRHD